MTSEHDEHPANGQPDDDTPRDYKYRFKYLHKYGDAPPEGGGEEHAGKQQTDEPKDDKRDEEKKDDQDKKDESPEEQRRQKRKRIVVIAIIAAVFLLAGLAWLLYDIFVLSQRETTDDAYVRGDMVTISSRVAGTVVEVAAEETERVHAGQVLVRLDPADASVSLLNAQGQLAQAVRQAQQSIEQAGQADAAIAQRRAQYETERDDYARRHPLLEKRAVSKEEVDTGRRQMQAALAALQQAERQAAAAHAQVDGIDVHDFPSVVQARAQFRNAWVNGGRNAIVSPIDGYAARRQVQVGQRVQPGQDLMTIVPLADLWIDANFKETQLEHIRIGQPVEVTTDMYSKLKFHGRVAGLNAGTGSAFSLLPAENASGNWIKVVQRLPVRITLDEDALQRFPLRIGLSTYVKVDTENRDGKVLAQTSRSKPLASTDVYEQEMSQADAHAEAIIQANMVGTRGSTEVTTSGKRGR
jgi:membrane fusion protein (multidrug efflux system)